MAYIRRCKGRLLALAIALAMAAVSVRAQGPVVAQLLGPAQSGDLAGPAGQIPNDTIQSRSVSVDTTALAADVLDIDVTQDVTLRAVLGRRDALRGGGQAWSGRVTGDALSSVTLVVQDGVFQGSIRTMAAAYSIEPSGPGYVVRQVDTRLAAPELEPLHPPADDRAAAVPDAPPPVGRDDGSTIDVLVLYTPGARTSAGGTDGAVQARIALGIAETNTGYASSGIAPRLRLVGTQLLAYTEVGMSADLSALRSNISVQALRNSLGADLVALIVANSAEACGVGYIMTNAAGFEGYGYSLTAYSCISPNYSFGHELGHNMGSSHAPEDGGSGFHPYSYGYKHPGRLFRTVMAYDCPGGGCPRVLHFSNPDVSYSGAPTGTAVQHDNARSIDSNASIVANFRPDASAGAAPTLAPLGDVSVTEDGATGAIAIAIADADTAASSLTVNAVSSNTALVPNTAAALALGGGGGSRTLTVTPAANQSGTSSITVSVSDGTQSASRSFTLTVTAVNDPPTIVRSPAAATVAPGVATQTSVTVSDIDTAGSALALSTGSSNATLLPNGNIAVAVTGTTATSRTFTVTMTPAPGQSGTATVTLNGLDGGALATTTFALTVTSVNQPPVFAAGVPTSVSTVVSTPASFEVTLSDPDSAGTTLTLAGITTNAAVLANGGVAVAAIGSTATSRTFSVTLTPVTGATGTGGVTLTAADGVATATRTVQLSVAATLGAPDPPTTMTATVSGASLQLSWTPATTGAAATGFAVAVGTAPGATTLPVQTTAATSIAIAVPSSGTYYARVQAMNAAGSSIASPEAEAIVSLTGGAPGRTPRPRAWTSGRALFMEWDPPSGGDPVTGYVLEAGSAPGLANLAVLPLSAVRSFSTGVPVGTFWLRVRAVNAAGTGDPSEDVGLVMGAANGCVGLPLAPAALSAAVSGSVVTFAWAPPAGGGAVTSYVIYAGAAPGRVDLARVGTGSTAASWSGAAPPGVYYVRVAARTACGIGPLSGEVEVAVGGAPPPAAPGALSGAVTDRVVTLTWSAPVSGPVPSSYVVEAGSASGASNVAALGTGGPVTALSGAAPPGRYYIRVRARAGGVLGPVSNEIVLDVP
jgi:hypothetical protein